MIDHAAIKLIHVSCVTLSIIGFLGRGTLMFAKPSLLSHPVIKKAPHYIDATLLFSGIWLAINIQQYPGTTPWLSAKLVALVAYIVFGSFALRGKTRRIRILAFIGALTTFTYMVSVAFTRTAFPQIPT